MTEKKYSLKIVNNKKPFIMPKWTVGKHKAALARMLKENPKVSEEEKNDLFNYYVIYETLRQVDPEISIEDIKDLHPEDMIELFNEVYNAGKEGIYFRQPAKGKK
jgi:hypothetical protein